MDGDNPNNGHSQGGFVPMPFINLQQLLPQQRAHGPSNEVPARVAMAFSFLRELTHKTDKKICVSDVRGGEEFDGQKLTEHEKDAQQDALHLLSCYFRGRLKPDFWEAAAVRADIGLHPAECYGFPAGQKGRRFPCIVCDPKQPRKVCMLCRGTGSFLAFTEPEGGPEEEGCELEAGGDGEE